MQLVFPQILSMIVVKMRILPKIFPRSFENVAQTSTKKLGPRLTVGHLKCVKNKINKWSSLALHSILHSIQRHITVSYISK